MFTIQDIKAAHSRVKSGVDFPRYIQDLRQLGVHAYETFVPDGHALYTGEADYKLASEAIYGPLEVLAVYKPAEFAAALKLHQQGGTDYLQFCQDCAINGVYSWITDLEALTCTYYDADKKEILVERIPS
ncbi:DUF1398 domain-containing protein [Sphingobacterium bambusae]|uniref:DUF1398 domain-containing protein n=1 Tax=Sphingobacterium bambusae TaxID=662858 RepID=A0ABW6BPC2_9SPHI|nr:DUF1398 family protein [Sphingobacterium bambusae]WPL49861.1 DUF1398 family protein [Sphingobacterium bambusae]